MCGVAYGLPVPPPHTHDHNHEWRVVSITVDAVRHFRNVLRVFVRAWALSLFLVILSIRSDRNYAILWNVFVTQIEISYLFDEIRVSTFSSFEHISYAEEMQSNG